MADIDPIRFGTAWTEDLFDGEIAFWNMRSEFNAAEAKYPGEVHESSYAFAGQRVRMRVVGDELARHIVRPFSHLQTDELDSGPVRLTIEIWDESKMNSSPHDALNRDGLEWTEITVNSTDARYVG